MPPNWFCRKLSQYEYLKSLRRDFENYDFSTIYGHFKFYFWPFLAIFGHKLVKNQNFQIPIFKIADLAPTLKRHNFLTNDFSIL